MAKRISDAEHAARIGLRFGYLEVLAFKYTKAGNSRRIYVYECLCHLCNSKTEKAWCEIIKECPDRSCGCKKRGDRSYAWTGFGELPGTVINSIKIDAKKRNMEFNVSAQYLWELFLKQDRKCVFSGVELNFNKVDRTASLDRIDNSKGYIEGNVQWVYRNLNFMKHTKENEFVWDMCSKVSANLQQIKALEDQRREAALIKEKNFMSLLWRLEESC